MKRILLPLIALFLIVFTACKKEPTTPDPDGPTALEMAGTTWVCDQTDDLNETQQAHVAATLSFLESTGTLSVHADLINNGEVVDGTDREYDIVSYTTNLNGGTVSFADGNYTTFTVTDGEMEMLAPFVLPGITLHFTQLQQ